MPFLVEPVWLPMPGLISIVTLPPLASVISPFWTAAVQTGLSEV
jgi:hypothetical protein